MSDPATTARPLFSVTSSQRVFDGAVTSVRIDDVVMPDGDTAKREVVEHDNAVAIVALDSAGRAGSGGGSTSSTPGSADMVILIEQYRHPLGRRLWELPAGLMDVDGEGAQQTAARELDRGDRVRRGELVGAARRRHRHRDSPRRSSGSSWPPA